MKDNTNAINQIEKKYRSGIDTYKNAIKAWTNVKRVSKKDGSDFANFGKNFTNATFKQEYPWAKPELKVDYKCGYGYAYDSIEVEENDTVNDVFRKINDRIRVFSGNIAEAEKKASNTKTVFNEVDKTMVELMKFCKSNGFSSYEVCNYIHDNCWRLGE